MGDVVRSSAPSLYSALCAVKDHANDVMDEIMDKYGTISYSS